MVYQLGCSHTNSLALSIIFSVFHIAYIITVFTFLQNAKTKTRNRRRASFDVFYCELCCPQCAIPYFLWFPFIKGAFDFTQTNETAVGKIASELSIFVMRSVDGAPCVNVCTSLRSGLPSHPFHCTEDSGQAGASFFLYLFSRTLHKQHGIEPDERIAFYRSVHFSYSRCFLCFIYASSGENSCVGPRSSATDWELISPEETGQGVERVFTVLPAGSDTNGSLCLEENSTGTMRASR